MLMIVMSLAISLVSVHNFYTHPQNGEISSQAAQSYQGQQENKDAKNPKTLPNVPSVTPIALPPGDHAWAVRILSSGGFSGKGRGDLTLASDGILYWNGPDGGCSRKLSDETLNALTKVVLAADLTVSSREQSPVGFCADCYTTSMIVQQRGVAEVIRALRVSWDDTNRTKVPADILAVYDSLMAQRGCKLQ
jgi:hypothetical protein